MSPHQATCLHNLTSPICGQHAFPTSLQGLSAVDHSHQSIARHAPPPHQAGLGVPAPLPGQVSLVHSNLFTLRLLAVPAWCLAVPQG